MDAFLKPIGSKERTREALVRLERIEPRKQVMDTEEEIFEIETESIRSELSGASENDEPAVESYSTPVGRKPHLELARSISTKRPANRDSDEDSDNSRRSDEAVSKTSKTGEADRTVREREDSFVSEGFKALREILMRVGNAAGDVREFCCEQSKNVKNSIKDQTVFTEVLTEGQHPLQGHRHPEFSDSNSSAVDPDQQLT